MSSCSTSTSSSSLKRNFSAYSSSSTTSSSEITIKEDSSLSSLRYFPQELEKIIDIKSLICSFLEPEEAEKISASDPKLKEGLFPVDNNEQNEENMGSELIAKKQKMIKHTVFREKLNQEYNFATLPLKREYIEKLLGPSSYENYINIKLLNKGMILVYYASDNKNRTKLLLDIRNYKLLEPIPFQYHLIPPYSSQPFKQISENIIVGEFISTMEKRDIQHGMRKVIFDISDDSFKIIAILPADNRFTDSASTFCKLSKNLMAVGNIHNKNYNDYNSNSYKDLMALDIFKKMDCINLYNVTSPEQSNIIISFKGHTAGVTSLCKISDNILASASYDHTIKLWDIAEITKPNCIAILAGHTAGVMYITKISDNILASASEDCTIKLWNITDTTRPICLTTLEGHLESVNYMIKMSSNIIASASSDGSVKIWDITNLDNPLKATLGESRQGYAFSSGISKMTENILATQVSSNVIKYWNIGKYIHNSEHPFIKGN